MMDILKRLESLEQHIVSRDNNKMIDFDGLLAEMEGDGPKVDKPTQAEPSEPIDFDKMVETLADYRKSQFEKKDQNEIPQEFIIE